MITYKTTVMVYLDGGRPVGRIREIKRNDGTVVYQYFPKGSKYGGNQYSTLEQCKTSLGR